MPSPARSNESAARLVTIDDVRAAAARLGSGVHRTPLVSSRTLSRLAGCDLRLKLESFQRTGSFKIRGALNRVAALSEEERRQGVVSVSAGNHAQGLACAAAESSVRAVIVMPETASPAKVAATLGYGAEVVRHGDPKTLVARAREIAALHGLTFVHAFDEPEIVAGAGTVGLEIAEDAPDTDVVVAGVGGGGLLSGVAVAVRGLLPGSRVVGVEPEGAPKMARSLEAGRAVALECARTVADGLAAPFAGALTFEHVRALASGVVLVSDEEILGAVRLLLEREKILVEPAGAAAVAALLAGRVPEAKGRRVVAVVSGGNADLARLREWL